MRLAVLTVLLAGCADYPQCTLLACDSRLALRVTSGQLPVSAFSGEIRVDGTPFRVACGSPEEEENDPAVFCGEDGEVTLLLGEVPGGDEISYELEATRAVDVGGDVEGLGRVRPAWRSWAPGEDCGGDCWAGEGEIALDAPL
jgi:hypothetical protein